MTTIHAVSCPCCSYAAEVPVGRGHLPIVHTPALCGRCADFVDLRRPDTFELLGDDYDVVAAIAHVTPHCPGCAAPVREVTVGEVHAGAIPCPSCGSALTCATHCHAPA